MRLTDLVDDEGGMIGHGGDVEVTGLASDSRKVRPGYLFAALSGTVTDGSRFVADAVSRGAVAVLASPEVSLTGVPGADVVAVVLVFRLTAGHVNHCNLPLTSGVFGWVFNTAE